MNLSQTARESLTSILEKLGLAWWVEIVTEQPKCTYYFGPFLSAKSAEIAQPGYIEDLEQEGTLLIAVVSKQCKPRDLTIFEDELAESSESGRVQPVGSQ